MNGVLQNGMVPGAARSNRSHNYVSAVRLDNSDYTSGMRSNQPIELAIDPLKAMEAGCELFVTETESVLTRGTIPPSCIVSAVDAAKKDLPLYVAGEKEATREGEPGHSFRAKHDYEEAASSSSAPPPKQAAVAPKAVASKKMLKSSSSKPELHLPLSSRMWQWTMMPPASKGVPSDAANADDDEGYDGCW